MSGRVTRNWVLAGAVCAALLAIVVVRNSLDWIGRPFPGFFLLANRVVPSIALPDWPDPSRVFQHQVLAVDGTPVSTSAEAYERIRAVPPNTAIRYTLRSPEGTITEAVVRSRIFSRTDYVFLFGALFLSGSAFLVAGFLVVLMKPQSAASHALLYAGMAIGTFALTALDLYGPHWFFRLHVAGEVLIAPAFLYLALVFPTDRARGWHRRALLAVYLPFLVLIAFYEAVLWSPSLYSLAHLVAIAGQAVAGMALLGAVTVDLLTTRSPLVRRRLAVVALGSVSGFVLPTVLMAASGVLGGSVAINGAALTAFFFPLSLAYGILKDNLFEIDVILRRAITYSVVVCLIGGLYFLVLYALGVLIPGQLSSWTPVALACLNFVLLFLVSSVRERVQKIIDRVFFRQGYQVDHALSSLSQKLASARTVDEVAHMTARTLLDTCTPKRAAFLLLGPDGLFRAVVSDDESESAFALPEEICSRLEHEGIAARCEWEDDSRGLLPDVWTPLQAELLVAIRSNQTMLGLLVLGRKSSGRAYSSEDGVFLRTASNQIAMALTNAFAFTQLEDLNANLERLVRDRTSALHASNSELNRSLAKLTQAYEQLEQSQTSLLRADRLATLGRLTAGIAHEMNTPLSAVLNALKLLDDLGKEYQASIDDADVLPEDHREIAGEIIATARAASGWAEKAASYISSVKAHGRESRPAVAHRFPLQLVVDEARALLAHRLRKGGCQIDFHEEPAGISLLGDPSRLGQVLLNLCGNAVDAYEDGGSTGGRIEVRAKSEPDTVVLTIRDWAGGIPPHVFPHIFDELFTTKGPGRGTGLGLWICRNLVEQVFGGALTAETTPGLGSCFTAVLPISRAAEPVQGADGDAETAVRLH